MKIAQRGEEVAEDKFEFESASLRKREMEKMRGKYVARGTDNQNMYRESRKRKQTEKLEN